MKFLTAILFTVALQTVSEHGPFVSAGKIRKVVGIDSKQKFLNQLNSNCGKVGLFQKHDALKGERTVAAFGEIPWQVRKYDYKLVIS